MKNPECLCIGYTTVVLDYSNLETKEKKFTLLQLQKIQIYSRGKTEFKKPNNPRLDKIDRRVQNLKILGKKVTAATIGDYLANTDLWTISSLINRLF